MADTSTDCASSKKVLEEELQEIELSREKRFRQDLEIKLKHTLEDTKASLEKRFPEELQAKLEAKRKEIESGRESLREALTAKLERIKVPLPRFLPWLVLPAQVLEGIRSYQEKRFERDLMDELAKLKAQLEEEFPRKVEEELERIKRPYVKDFKSRWPVVKAGPPEERAGKSRLLGLAFSGGGIRSATFNLGVLQGLANLGLLSRFDYLSTVSGGGYIGSWFAAWIARRGLNEVREGLQTDRKQLLDNAEPREIRFLREYSNYLTPRRGLLGTDTWTMVVTYLRNTMLNLTSLALALIAVLILPRLATLSFNRQALLGYEAWPWKALSLLLFAITFTVMNLSDLFRVEGEGAPKRFQYGPVRVFVFLVIPLLCSSWWFTEWLWRAHDFLEGSWFWWGIVAGLAYTSLWFLGWMAGGIPKLWKTDIESSPPAPITPDGSAGPTPIYAAVRQAVFTAYGLTKQVPGRARRGIQQVASVQLGAIVFSAFISGIVGGWLFVPVAWCLGQWSAYQTPGWAVASFGFPLVVMVFLITAALHIGLASRGLSDDAREWLARLGATLLLWTLLLTILFAISIYGPWVLLKAGLWLKGGLVLSWLLTTGAGILAGKSRATGLRDNKRALAIIARVAPPVFVLGILVLVAVLTQAILPPIVTGTHEFLNRGSLMQIHHWLNCKDHPSASTTRGTGAVTPERFGTHWRVAADGAPKDRLAHYWKKMDSTLDGCLWVSFIGFLLLALGLSDRVGINDFGMHEFYRNRLTRCYLGATNGSRSPHPFTGFDPEDDRIKLDHLNTASSYCGPYPIVNATLNLVSGQDLAWQQRKAESFVFAPLYSGYLARPNRGFARQLGGKAYIATNACGRPITLGTAMATSGAAASPNMGYHSSPALSFLMTVFNVRLGLWLGNTRQAEQWAKPGPGFGLFYLFCELLGQTNDRRSFVYLSDGGHFENLGIYELVRRHCAFIVACDASEDHELKFGDLGNAIEKCRTDFGVDIEIDVEQLRRQKGTGLSQWHCAIGRIRYDNAYPNAPVGTLVYLKPSLTGDEPQDVQRYKAEHREFPHQTTADQWFDEPQFESYRALGQHIVTKVLEAIADTDKLRVIDTRDLFPSLLQHWYPPSRYVRASFTKHTATYTRLLEKMRLEPNLRFLDQQVYPEWPKLKGVAAAPPAAGLWLPPSEEERRAGFYLCNEVIQLMEDVYIDLNLEQEYNHPDNRGWMNLFRHWAWSGMFIATWAISASTYGARFQRFCERRLDLRLGEVEIPDPKGELKLTKVEDQRSTALEKAKQAQLLNFWEVELIRTFLTWGRKPEELSDLQILPFEMVVEGPARVPNQKFRFAFGFALVTITSAFPERVEICYFRVQNHLRKMGLARKALQELMKKYRSRVENKVKTAPPRPLDDPTAPPEGTSKDEALPTAEAVQQFRQLFDSIRLEGEGHERAVADQLLASLQIGATFERLGDPEKNEPDVIYKIEGRTVGIEVATAYYKDSDAKDAWEIAAGEKPLLADEVRPRSGGVLKNPDQMICERVQAELEDKCAKTYEGTDETWLCINLDAPLIDAASVTECARSLKIPAKHRFARIYLTYTAPAHEGGGYESIQIR